MGKSGWLLVVLGLTALLDSISVYIGPSPKEREKVGPCPTVIQIVGRPGTGSLPSTITPPDHPWEKVKIIYFLETIAALGLKVA